MTPMKWFLFVLFFTVDIRVKASNEFYEQPKGCLKKASACALRTKNTTFALRNKDIKFQLGPQSLVLRNSQSELEFIEGTLWVDKYESLSVKTVFGQIVSESGPYLVMHDESKILIRNINANLDIHLRDGKKIELPVGFQIWISGLDEKGRSVSGIPEMIDIEGHIREWSKVYSGTKDEFRQEVAGLKLTWGSLPERSSQLNFLMAKHQQKLQDQRRDRIQQRQIARELEQQEIRELYRQKVFWR